MIASPASPRTAMILLSCPDATGIIADVTGFLRERRGNIVDLDQHVDREAGILFMRVEWELDGFDASGGIPGRAFDTLSEKYQMRWKVHFSDRPPRVALFVSKQDHCLYDLLARAQSAEWPRQPALIISNHENLAPVAERFGIPFHAVGFSAATRGEAEKRQREILTEAGVDTIVLAKYMQILSPDFVSAFPHAIINIHHSFLPAFPGARPYHAAHERGVKIIGATSHYVTEELDAGPIIDQEVTRVSHRDEVADLVRKGRDLERLVLARAVWNHLHRKILVYGNRTVIFE